MEGGGGRGGEIKSLTVTEHFLVPWQLPRSMSECDPEFLESFSFSRPTTGPGRLWKETETATHTKRVNKEGEVHCNKILLRDWFSSGLLLKEPGYSLQ